MTVDVRVATTLDTEVSDSCDFPFSRASRGVDGVVAMPHRAERGTTTTMKVYKCLV